MPIQHRIAKVKAAAAKPTTSTHDGNDDKLNIEEGDTDLKNHMSADTLVDPEDCTPGSTHSMTEVKASADQQNVGTIDEDVDPAAGYLEEGAAEDQNVGTLENDVDPAAGVLENAAAADDEELEGDEDIPADEVDAALEGTEPDTLENNNGDTPLEVEAAGEDADWDAEPEADAPTIEDIEDDEAVEEDMEDEGDDVAEVEDLPAVGEELAMLDVDEVDDKDTDGVAFASMGTRLMVIKANRIIATMTKRMAVASGREDVYLTDQFQEVTASELDKKGLRKGLKGMGFALAKVNVSKASVVNARVEAAVTKTTAAVRKVTAGKEAAFQQSLTIAAVGINRRYFNEQPNELKEYLESALAQAGVRGAPKLLQTAFAKFGPAYAKTIVELATKISAMPQESRDGFVSALDLTSEDMDAPEEDVVPVGEGEPFADNNEQDFGDEFEDDTVVASLATPGIPRRKEVVKAGSISLAASAILNGDQPLFM